MKILVMGAGPAGCASAIALTRLGLDVELWTGPDRRPRLEGLSRRTVEALGNAGCHEAAELAASRETWVNRFVRWGPLCGETNQEGLVDRCRLDAALLRDARHAGVSVVRGSARGSIPAGEEGDEIGAPTGRCAADAWIDARGRSTPRGPGAIRGVATVALDRSGAMGADAPLATALIAAESGFFWVAVRAGRARVLWFRDPPSKPNRGFDLDAAWERAFDALRVVQGPAWLAGLSLGAEAETPRGRDATPYLAAPERVAVEIPPPHLPVSRGVTPTLLRVGDAALAGDPLSGQGVFRALATAGAAAAAIHTLLGRPERRELALRFYRDRVRSIFRREAEKSGEFYRSEARWSDSPFWRARRVLQASPPQVATARFETRPIVRAGWVEEAPVLVSPAHPEGVWSYEGVPLAPLVEPGAGSAADLAGRFSLDRARVERALAWLRGQGVEPQGSPRPSRPHPLTAPLPIPQSDRHG